MSLSTPMTSTASIVHRAQSGGEAAAMLGKIEAIHGAREIQVAIGIEDAHEALGLGFQITLDRKARRERLERLRITGEPARGRSAAATRRPSDR